MNSNTVSDECFLGMCSSCEYEDCTCNCHERDLLCDGPEMEEEEEDAD